MPQSSQSNSNWKKGALMRSQPFKQFRARPFFKADYQFD